jgi:hypothetical protein
VVCRGKYVAMLEGNDYWTHEDKLQTQINFLDEHPDHAICCHRAQFVDETGSGQSRIFPTLPAGTYTIADLFDGNNRPPGALRNPGTSVAAYFRFSAGESARGYNSG